MVWLSNASGDDQTTLSAGVLDMDDRGAVPSDKKTRLVAIVLRGCLT